VTEHFIFEGLKVTFAGSKIDNFKVYIVKKYYKSRENSLCFMSEIAWIQGKKAYKGCSDVMIPG
jgi:hypothetical protein